MEEEITRLDLNVKYSFTDKKNHLYKLIHAKRYIVTSIHLWIIWLLNTSFLPFTLDNMQVMKNFKRLFFRLKKSSAREDFFASVLTDHYIKSAAIEHNATQKWLDVSIAFLSLYWILIFFRELTSSFCLSDIEQHAIFQLILVWSIIWFLIWK